MTFTAIKPSAQCRYAAHRSLIISFR